jgi:hypothetical protein
VFDIIDIAGPQTIPMVVMIMPVNTADNQGKGLNHRKVKVFDIIEIPGPHTFTVVKG